MKKINVIGTTGSGKSTFSKALSEKLGYSCIHMDQLFWKPNWEQATDDEFISKVLAAVSGETWVLDGNYSRANQIKWENADMVIWLDYSYLRTFIQLLKRTIARVLTRKELWPQTGNRESFRKSFMSKESIFVWFFKSYKENKLRYVQLMNSPNVEHIKFIRLCSPKEAKAFLDMINKG